MPEATSNQNQIDQLQIQEASSSRKKKVRESREQQFINAKAKRTETRQNFLRFHGEDQNYYQGRNDLTNFTYKQQYELPLDKKLAVEASKILFNDNICVFASQVHMFVATLTHEQKNGKDYQTLEIEGLVQNKLNRLIANQSLHMITGLDESFALHADISIQDTYSKLKSKLTDQTETWALKLLQNQPVLKNSNIAGLMTQSDFVKKFQKCIEDRNYNAMNLEQLLFGETSVIMSKKLIDSVQYIQQVMAEVEAMKANIELIQQQVQARGKKQASDPNDQNRIVDALNNLNWTMKQNRDIFRTGVYLMEAQIDPEDKLYQEFAKKNPPPILDYGNRTDLSNELLLEVGEEQLEDEQEEDK